MITAHTDVVGSLLRPAIATRIRHARQTALKIASSHAKAIPAAKALRAITTISEWRCVMTKEGLASVVGVMVLFGFIFPPIWAVLGVGLILFGWYCFALLLYAMGKIAYEAARTKIGRARRAVKNACVRAGITSHLLPTEWE
jgi:hypothetical protein